MKAPSEADRPAREAINAVPVTISRAVVVNTSGVRAPPMTRNSGGSRNRPATRIAAIAATPRTTPCQGTWLGSVCRTSRGTSATRGMKDRSWNSSTAKPSRPAREVSRSRSASIGSTMAVEDIASPVPSTTAPAQAMPVVWAMAARAAAHSSRCMVPRPNTLRRITHRRCGRTSRPIRNSSMTTPRLAILAICCTLVTRRRP